MEKTKVIYLKMDLLAKIEYINNIASLLDGSRLMDREDYDITNIHLDNLVNDLTLIYGKQKLYDEIHNDVKHEEG